MKKVLSLVAAISFAIVLISSCQKDNVSVNNTPSTIKSNSIAQKLGGLKGLKSSNLEGIYSLSSVVGHKSTDCGNACIMINGIRTHIDCQYWGSTCSLYAKINVSKVDPKDDKDPYYSAIAMSVFEPSDDSIFFMPNRSFLFKSDTFDKGYIWLNIPKQKLVRDKETNLFLYNNITFTYEQLYENR